MNAPDRWPVRWAYLACLLVTPFLKFLFRNGYGLLYPEVFAAVGLLAAASAILSWPRGVWYALIVALCAAVMATYPLTTLSSRLSFLPLWPAATAAGAVLFAAIRVMGRRFYPIMATFLLAGLAVEAVPAPQGFVTAGSKPGATVNRTLWLVLDEQIGLAGFPSLPECESARKRWTGVLTRYGFEIYPRAFSNYAATIDSVPSLLNGRLLREPGELIARQGSGHLRHYAVRQNALFEAFRAAGYEVTGFQHASLKTCRPGNGVECVEYRDRLGWLHEAPGGWVERFRWLVGTYQSSDPLLVPVKGFFPFRFGLKITGPLAVAGLWPREITAHVETADRPALLFGHLLTPHSPYLYRTGGSIRPLSEWAEDRADARVPAAEYVRRYSRYCEQSEYVANQFEDLLAELLRAGALPSLTIVVHGDHGARIRQALDGHPPVSGPEAMPELWDYPGDPDTRDLVDRFSTLLAIKDAGTPEPVVHPEAHSVLHSLAAKFPAWFPDSAGPANDHVYLIAPDGKWRALDFPTLWRNE